VNAVLRLKGNTDLQMIHIIKKLGGGLEDSFLDSGFILEKKIGVGQPKRMLISILFLFQFIIYSFIYSFIYIFIYLFNLFIYFIYFNYLFIYFSCSHVGFCNFLFSVEFFH
jgi:hypothetical protein